MIIASIIIKMITITIMADDQEGCEHGREKAWTIDPEKVIGGGVGSSVGWNFIFIIVMMINMLIIATEKVIGVGSSVHLNIIIIVMMRRCELFNII